MSNIFATKSNLMQSKKSLALAKLGYDLMDRKRNILVREMMALSDKVKLLRKDVSEAYKKGYYYLQQANITTGVISDIVKQVKIIDDISLTYRSIMGVEVPNVLYNKKELEIQYSLYETNSHVDKACVQFQKIRDITMILVEIDISVYRLARAIRKTQKRANALKNIIIPKLNAQIKFIADSLEEKEREEFSRLKIIKKNKK